MIYCSQYDFIPRWKSILQRLEILQSNWTQICIIETSRQRIVSVTVLSIIAYSKFVLWNSVLCIFFDNMSSISSRSSLSSRCHVKLAVYVLFFFFPTLNDRKVVVCLFLLYQLLMCTSWRFIPLFRRHLLHSSSLSRIHRWCFYIWGWTFSNIWICFLTELDKKYRQSPRSLFIPDNVTDVVLNRRLKGSLSVDYRALHQWVVIRPASSHLLLYFLTDTMCKIIRRLYRDHFSTIEIDRHIILSLFCFIHESVSYITDSMDNFDSETGRHRLFFFTCIRYFSYLLTSLRPILLHVLLLIYRHL